MQVLIKTVGALEVIESHGCIARVVNRGKKAQAKRRNPAKRVLRSVAEVCHGWFNRFREPLVGYEKLERSCVAA